MKLILKQYLASLKERAELDAVLPDLLSSMGMNVFISPTRGVKEYGVDMAAIGKVNGEEKKSICSLLNLETLLVRLGMETQIKL